MSAGKMSIIMLLSVSLSEAWASSYGCARAQPEGRWITLFNGKNLDGWKANVHPDSFTISDGVIKAHGIHGRSHLFYVGTNPDSPAKFKDFELKATVRGEQNSNSGIFFHTDHELRDATGHLAKGYEVQLNSSKSEKRKTGSLYAIVDLEESPVDERQWFEVYVRVEGKRILVKVNDKVTVDYTEPVNPTRPPERAKRLLAPNGALIALQAHDPNSMFYFKDIRIRPLP